MVVASNSVQRSLTKAKHLYEKDERKLIQKDNANKQQLSSWWSHFKIYKDKIHDPKQELAVCNHCGLILKARKQTSGLKRHMTSHHRDLLEA